MIRYLLDTNVISNLARAQPSPLLLAWFAARRDDDLFIASVTLAEIRRGILVLPIGRKRRALEHWFDAERGPRAFFSGRILPFDEPAAMHWATLMADGTREGRPRDRIDMIIAATALSRGCVVVTDNERDFAGLDVINPLRDAPR